MSTQDAPNPEFFHMIEASFSAIATQHQQPHRRLLALNWCAKFRLVYRGTFLKAFELWLKSRIEGGEG